MYRLCTSMLIRYLSISSFMGAAWSLAGRICGVDKCVATYYENKIISHQPAITSDVV